MSQQNIWLTNGFVKSSQCAPFVIDSDQEYYSNLRDRYKGLYEDAKKAGADEKSLHLIKRFTEKVCEAIRNYYKGNLSTCHDIIRNLVKDAIENPVAVETIDNSEALPGTKGTEVQFFRARINPAGLPYEAQDMLHLPFEMRGKTGNYRFSIPGVPSLYLCNTSYCCWLELGRPSEHDFMVSPVIIDKDLKVLNLAVMSRDIVRMNDFDEGRVHSWLMRLILMIATSYRIKEENRNFRSEYIISQSIMLACKRLKLDGIAYYSKQVEDEIFAFPAVNVALFAEYKVGERYADICKRIKVGKSFNYALFRQLHIIPERNKYDLRSLNNNVLSIIGTYERGFAYNDTQFAEFDKFLFSGWEKEKEDYGNALQKSEPYNHI